MFRAPFEQTQKALAGLKTNIRFNDGIRRAISNGTLQLPVDVASPPHPEDWRVSEHCGVVTRLYSIYEWLVHELIAEWLGLYADHTSYGNLPERVVRAHRVGIGTILAQFGGRRFRGLSLSTVVTDFAKALSGASGYAILPEAFVHHERNLRMEELVELVRDCGIELDVALWIREHPEVKRYLDASPLDNNAEKVLQSLVEYRNAAAHASVDVDDILGEATLLAYVEFFESLHRALYELFCAAALDLTAPGGDWSRIGRLTFVKKDDPTICVAAVKGGSVRQGIEVFFRGKRCCYPGVIESIHLDNVSVPTVTCVEDREIGLKASVGLLKGLELYTRVDLKALPISPKGSVADGGSS